MSAAAPRLDAESRDRSSKGLYLVHDPRNIPPRRTLDIGSPRPKDKRVDDDLPYEEPREDELASKTFHAVMALRGEVRDAKAAAEGARGGVLFLDEKFDLKFDHLEGRVGKLESITHPEILRYDTPYPRASPSGHHLTVEASEYVKVGEEKIMAVRERDSLRIAVASEQRARELAEARAEGAEGAAKKLTERIKLWVAVLGAVALVGGSIWTLAVLTHPPTPPTTTHSP
jgi:hypothetical protein